MLKIFLSIVVLLFFTACQKSASSNVDSSFTQGASSFTQGASSFTQGASLKYPLKTGQRSSFSFHALNSNTYYTDDGDFNKQMGYVRSFVQLHDGTVYNTNYDLYWQDEKVSTGYSSTKAAQYCADLTLANRTDWRLPNVFELMTLLDLESRTDLRESSFKFMPVGAYFTSEDVLNSDKAIVVNFGAHKFSITKILKEMPVTADANTSVYGVKFGTTSVPTYNVPSAQDPLAYLSKIVKSDMYYNASTGFQTIVSTDTFYNSAGKLDTTMAINPVGPYVSSTGGTQFNPTVAQNQVATNIKCVSGKEIKGFYFVRDDRNDVVLDRATNLMWQDNNDVIRNDLLWGRATEYCDKLTLGGFKDWRLPTISELITLNDFSVGGTYSVSNVFRYKIANKFHSSSDSSFGVDHLQNNYLLNTSGYLNDKVSQSLVNYNPATTNDANTSERTAKTRCVRQGSYNQ